MNTSPRVIFKSASVVETGTMGMMSRVKVSLTYVLYRNNLDIESATLGSQSENLVYQKRAGIKKTFKTFSVYSESCVA